MSPIVDGYEVSRKIHEIAASRPNSFNAIVKYMVGCRVEVNQDFQAKCCMVEGWESFTDDLILQALSSLIVGSYVTTCESIITHDGVEMLSIADIVIEETKTKIYIDSRSPLDDIWKRVIYLLNTEDPGYRHVIYNFLENRKYEFMTTADNFVDMAELTPMHRLVPPPSESDEESMAGMKIFYRHCWREIHEEAGVRYCIVGRRGKAEKVVLTREMIEEAASANNIKH